MHEHEEKNVAQTLQILFSLFSISIKKVSSFMVFNIFSA